MIVMRPSAKMWINALGEKSAAAVSADEFVASDSKIPRSKDPPANEVTFKNDRLVVSNLVRPPVSFQR